MGDCKREPQCQNCSGPDVAMGKGCPKHKIPEENSPQLRQQPLRPPKTSYAAVTKVADSTQPAAQANSRDQRGTKERASTDWAQDWAKIIANGDRRKP